MDIVLIGSGKVANILAGRIHKAGHHIVQVLSRTAASALQLARRHDIPLFGRTGGSMVARADLYIFAITDDALLNDHSTFLHTKNPVVHTSGSVSMEVLSRYSPHYGTLYPLQSLNEQTSDEAEIPFLLDAIDEETLNIIKAFAESISKKVSVTNDKDRASLHLAAVFVNNFTNHLYALAQSYCERHNLDFSLLEPLLLETAKRVEGKNALSLQTGPAVRGDETTIEKHLKLLKTQPDLLVIYTVLTESILQYHAKTGI